MSGAGSVRVTRRDAVEPPHPGRERSLGVVIPLFNGAAWIEEALETVFAQSEKPDEVVVVDDGSQDDGAERAGHFPGVRIVPSLGKRRARHTGFRNTSAELLAFLDQDDVWHPDHLRLLCEAIEAEPHAPAAVTAWVSFYDGAAPELDAEREGRSRLDPWATWPITCPITTPSAMLFRRGALEAAGAWALDAAPDWETYMRLTGPATFVRLEAATCGYRIHPHAESAKLRRDGWRYLDAQCRGADAALAERLARGVDEETRALLERRREVLAHVEALMQAVTRGDGAEAAEAARRIERDTASEEDALVDGIFEVLTYLFCPDEGAEAYRRRRLELLASLDRVWPKDAPRTRRLLARHDRPPFRWRRYVRALLKGRFDEARRLRLAR